MALTKIGITPTIIRRLQDGLKVTAKDFNNLIDGIRAFYPESGSVVVPVGSVSTPSIVSNGAAGVVIGPTTAGFTTAGSHKATLTGAGRWVVNSTPTTGGIGIDTTTGLCPVVICAASEEKTLTGAISVANFLTTIDTTAGATTYTLAAGVTPGQLKKILLRVDNGDATVTGAFTGANNTLTFSDAGEYALLMWDGTDWIALELSSVLNMTHAPVLSQV